MFLKTNTVPEPHKKIDQVHCISHSQYIYIFGLEYYVFESLILTLAHAL